MSSSNNMFPKKIVWSGLPEGVDAFLLVKKLQNENLSIIHVARNDNRALALKKAVRFFDPIVPILDFPAWDCLPYDRVSPNKEILALRVSTLSTLIMEPSRPKLVITTANAISQRVPLKEVIANSSIFNCRAFFEPRKSYFRVGQYRL